jgi:hypothetical protein
MINAELSSISGTMELAPRLGSRGRSWGGDLGYSYMLQCTIHIHVIEKGVFKLVGRTRWAYDGKDLEIWKASTWF